MNKLHALFKLRGIPITQIAREQHVGYHSLQKTVKGTRKTTPMLLALARYLGLSEHALLGQNSDTIITHLIEKEIETHTKKRHQELRRIYLGHRKAA